MEIIYRANDGTPFNDKEECERYEESLNKWRSEVHIYDKDFKELSFNDFEWEERVCFFKCETRESFNIFEKDFSWVVLYKHSEKLDLFFKDENTNFFMTTRDCENFLGYGYRRAKEFQEKLEKVE